jgi:hypothetical protein
LNLNADALIGNYCGVKLQWRLAIVNRPIALATKSNGVVSGQFKGIPQFGTLKPEFTVSDFMHYFFPS